jgi:predicted nucleic acid-binding protein
MLRALDLYSTYPNLDFEDCLTVAQVEQQKIATLMSYDRGFDRMPTIRREEPRTSKPLA